MGCIQKKKNNEAAGRPVSTDRSRSLSARLHLSTLKMYHPEQATYVMREIHEGYVVLIEELRQWQPKYYGQAIVGRPYRMIVQNFCKSVLSVGSIVVYLTKNLRIFTTFSPRGHLISRGWISSDSLLQVKDNINFYW